MTFRPVTEETSVTHFARKSCLGDELWQNCLKSWEETQKSRNNKLHWNSGEQTFVIFILTFTPNGNQTLNYPHCWPSHHQHRWPDRVPLSVFFLLNSACCVYFCFASNRIQLKLPKNTNNGWFTAKMFWSCRVRDFISFSSRKTMLASYWRWLTLPPFYVRAKIPRTCKDSTRDTLKFDIMHFPW